MNPKREIVKQELIGLDITIVDAKNQDLIGLKGKVIDETKNTMTIEQDNKTKKILKNQIIFNTKVDNKTIQINGKLLVGRPEERLKRR